ncbi:membrane protein insertase YidC [Saccharopolyspora phatthalungensis]|uniref:Membrane protein insertase YidC n=1 Tax=Saccharopolyspora phatthalungensis TaxID=664693 RepID=A0A840Q6G7_9PSEU|nr:membrane protein insertase YidC [Saccharopolyspora phatthalungensis]MBB5154298.1 YidC/Oxa1 family membrane protein insertase [Saccharopolyspora phatthalungensis]
MLDFIYYPVSAILWFWHKVFGFVLDPASGYAWALAVMFLVFTLRALLFKPFVHQVRSMKKMQEFAPQIRELQAKYGDDRQKLATEMQKLQAEQGFNPISGCLPMLVQIPVFIGLFHVLNGFKPGAPSNFIFNADDVASFVAADLFGAKLSNTISQSPEVLATFGTDRLEMMLVGVPLMIAAAIATHFTARHSVQRQTADAAANPQAAVMNRMTLWIFPMFAIIGGPFLPLAILLYWLANNFWTLGQQRVVYRRIDREEAALAGAPAVVESTVVEADTIRAADPAAKDEPGEIPGVIEDRSRDTGKPGESR